jgi:hypothetical protein
MVRNSRILHVMLRADSSNLGIPPRLLLEAPAEGPRERGEVASDSRPSSASPLSWESLGVPSPSSGFRR